MKKTVASIVAAIVISQFAAAPQTMAQGPAIAYPSNNWSYIHHSSTAGEGILRGQASYLSAAGDLTYMDSLAAVNYQEAYRRAIDNSVAITKAYYERAQIRDEYLRKYGPRPLSIEGRRRVAESYQPKRLSAQEFNHDTAQLVWPHILRQERYAPLKDQVDQAFAGRTEDTSGDGSVSQRKISQLCDALMMLLRENIGTMAPDQYIAAREFIRSIDLEAKTSVRSMAQANEPPEPDDPNPPATDDSVTKGSDENTLGSRS